MVGKWRVRPQNCLWRTIMYLGRDHFWKNAHTAALGLPMRATSPHR
jgi:hypothetical protein